MLLENISVTVHALERWRERVASRRDAGLHEVVVAVKEARLVSVADFLPMARLPNTRYYRHDAHACWFVVEPVGRLHGRVVTVVSDDCNANPVLPKLKAPEADVAEPEATRDLNDPIVILNLIKKLDNVLCTMTRADPQRELRLARQTELRELHKKLKYERRLANAKAKAELLRAMNIDDSPPAD